MTVEEARAHYNFLLTLYIRKAETFGPVAFAFIKDHSPDQLGLTAEEQFTLYTAVAEAFADEPKRYTHKLDCLQKAADILPQTSFFDSALSRQIHQDILRLRAELDLYAAAMKPEPVGSHHDTAPEQIIVETDMPDYFLATAQRRASAYYQAKYRLTKESKVAQHFSGPTRRFEPETTAVHKEFPGACAPFVSARTGAWHAMLPFDLKISRLPEDPLEAGLRIWYAKIGYSFPLRYEMGRLCSYYDDQVLDIEMNDPHLLFVSVSPLKEQALGAVERAVAADVPMEIGLPRAFLDGTNTLGPYVQIGCNIKVWFDASAIHLLVQGAPDLHEYGLQGGAGLLTRTYASEKTAAYAGAGSQPWQRGLSFNFVNMHLQLLPDVTAAVIPANTPVFSLFPVMARGQYELTDARVLAPRSSAI
ncbi:MAG: hypothetical protein P0111_08710 [Nitrospira sp.]|nr:hypothetical protein [Nitrospira sp.]